MNGIKRGFTLVEMIVATLLLAIGVTAALGAISASIQLVSHAKRVQTAAMLAQQQLATLELQSSSLSPGSQKGDFSPLYPDYRWSEEIDSTQYPDLFKVTLHIEWGNPEQPQERDFVTFLRVPQQQSPGSSSSASGTSGGALGP